MTNQDKTALLSKLRAPVADEPPGGTRWPVLRAMARNYTAGKHTWDALDAEACEQAAEEIRHLRAALASAPVAREAKPHLAPPKCPITGRPFFMAIEHPELGMVPTYGGPYDSYTIPYMEGKPDQPWDERELFVRRYDHDWGGWREDESIPLRVIHEDVLHDLQDAAPQASEAVRDAAFSAGVKAAADLVKKMVDDYDADLGSTDPETGTREYPGEGATWVCEMQELEESIRALSAQPGAQRTGGSDV